MLVYLKALGPANRVFRGDFTQYSYVFFVL